MHDGEGGGGIVRGGGGEGPYITPMDKLLMAFSFFVCGGVCVLG